MTTPALIPIAILLAALLGECGCFWIEGGKAEVRAAYLRNISFVGEIAGHRARDINSAHEDLSLVSYLFGPRFPWRIHRITPFAQTLIGGVHGSEAILPNSNNSTTVPEAFAMPAGGGINIDVSRHLALRPFQADFLMTGLPNTGANRQNSLRLRAGIVFKLPRGN